MSAEPIEAADLELRAAGSSPAESTAAEEAYLSGGQHDFPTHPLEIAAALEAAGCRDADARELGWPDIFTLADHLYAQRVVQRLDEGRPVIELPGSANSALERPDLAESNEATERHLESQMGMRPQWRVLWRGILFTLPGLVLVGALPIPLTTAESSLIWVTLALSWGLGQGLAYGGYMRVSLSPGDARAHMVPWVLLHGLVMAIAVTAVVASGAARPLVGLVAFTQSVYLIAASGLMVLGLESSLYGLLSVGAIAGIYRIVPPLEADPSLWGACLAIVSMLSASAVLLWTCRPSARTPALTANLVSRTTMISHVAMGLTSAVLVLWLPWFAGAGIGLTFVLTPLVLSLGGIEWLLLWLRGEGRRNLAGSRNLSSYKSRSTRALGEAATAYFLTVVLLVSLGWVAYHFVGGDAEGDPLLPIATVTLGMYLLFSAVATALYGLRFALAGSIGAVLLLMVAPLWLSGQARILWFTVVCMGLAVVTYAAARRQVRIPGNLG